MQTRVVANLLGIDVGTQAAKRAYLTGHGWRAEPAWRRDRDGKKVYVKGEDWILPNDTADFSIDGALNIQLTREAVARLVAAGWEITGGGLRDGLYIQVHEVSRKVDGRMVRKTLVGALRASRSDVPADAHALH